MAENTTTDGGRDLASILIVDDERGPRESLRMILTPKYRVLQSICEGTVTLKLKVLKLSALKVSQDS